MRKKSISWIEFLITFGIFISVILFIINRYLDFSQLVYNQIYQFVQIQKVSSLALYLLVNESTNYQNILETFRKNYKGFLFRYEQYPFIIFLDRSYEKASCINCIKFYNYNAECYVFEQNSTYDITSRLSVILFSTKDITLQGAKYICYPYLNLSVAIFGSVRYYKYCDIELSGNLFIFCVLISSGDTPNIFAASKYVSFERTDSGWFLYQLILSSNGFPHKYAFCKTIKEFVIRMLATMITVVILNFVIHFF